MLAMRIIEGQQYTEQFWEAKRGRPSASSFDRIITPKTAKLSSGSKKYIAELIAERAQLNPPFFTNRSGHTEAMRNGVDCEPEARRWYEAEKNCKVIQVCTCISDDGRFAASPDGVVGPEGLLELKCPTLSMQAEYLMEPDKLLTTYRPQVHGQLYVTGRKWVDLVSYAPGLDPVIIHVVPDPYTEALATEIELFWDMYNAASLKVLGKPAPGCRVDPVAFAATMAAFDRMLAGVTSAEELNKGLEALKDLDLNEPVRRGAWEKILELAKARGWAYDQAKKQFQKPPF